MTPKPQLLWHWTSKARDSELVHRHRKAKRPWVGIRSKSLSPSHCWHRLKKGDYAEKQNSSSSESLINGLIKYTPSPLQSGQTNRPKLCLHVGRNWADEFPRLVFVAGFLPKGVEKASPYSFLGGKFVMSRGFLVSNCKSCFCKWLFVRENSSLYVVFKFNKMFRQFGEIIVGFDKYFEYRHKSIPPKWDAGFIIIEESW